MKFELLPDLVLTAAAAKRMFLQHDPYLHTAIDRVAKRIDDEVIGKDVDRNVNCAFRGVDLADDRWIAIVRRNKETGNWNRFGKRIEATVSG